MNSACVMVTEEGLGLNTMLLTWMVAISFLVRISFSMMVEVASLFISFLKG